MVNFICVLPINKCKVKKRKKNVILKHKCFWDKLISIVYSRKSSQIAFAFILREGQLILHSLIHKSLLIHFLLFIPQLFKFSIAFHFNLISSFIHSQYVICEADWKIVPIFCSEIWMMLYTHTHNVLSMCFSLCAEFDTRLLFLALRFLFENSLICDS